MIYQINPISKQNLSKSASLKQNVIEMRSVVDCQENTKTEASSSLLPKTIPEEIKRIIPQAATLSLPVQGIDRSVGLGLSLGLVQTSNRGLYQGIKLDLGSYDLSCSKAQLWWSFDHSKGNRIVMTEEEISYLITSKEEIDAHNLCAMAQIEAQVLILDVNHFPPTNVS
jgi:hypothetical protein